MTAIEPDDIRVGDTVRRTLTYIEPPFKVTAVTCDTIEASRDCGYGYGKRSVSESETLSWELLDRPEVKPADGSKWKPAAELSLDNRWIYAAETDSYILWRRDLICAWEIGKTLPAALFDSAPMIPDDGS